jgi:hypothetical protein
MPSWTLPPRGKGGTTCNNNDGLTKMVLWWWLVEWCRRTKWDSNDYHYHCITVPPVWTFSRH